MHVAIRLFAVVALGLVSQITVAQHVESWVPGFIVTLEGETLRGEVVDTNDTRTTRSARFRMPGEDVRTFTPEELRGWGIDGGREFHSLTLVPTPGVSDRFVFAIPVLEGGAASLYRFEGTIPYGGNPDHQVDPGSSFRYALSVSGDGTYPMFYARGVQRDDSERRIVDRQYRRVLTAFAGALCPDLLRRIDRLGYSQREFVSIVGSLNACRNAEYIVREESLPRRSNLPANYGVRVSGGPRTITYHRDRTGFRPSFPLNDTGMGGNWTLEAVVEPFLTMITGGLSVPISVYGRRHSLPEGWIEEPVNPAQGTWYTTDDFNRFSAGLSLGLGYAIPIGRFAPYVRAGAFSHYLIGEKGQARIMTSSLAFPSLESGYYGELGGIAHVLPDGNAVTFGVRYEVSGIGHGTPRASLERSQWTTTSVQGVIGVRL